MKTVRLVWQRLMMMRRIRMRRIETSGPPHTHINPIVVAIAIAYRRPTIANMRRRNPTLWPAPPSDEETLGVGSVALEQNDVASIETLLLHVTAPPFGQNVALTAVPVRVTESPALT